LAKLIFSGPVTRRGALGMQKSTMAAKIEIVPSVTIFDEPNKEVAHRDLVNHNSIMTPKSINTTICGNVNGPNCSYCR
jgi:hypothetical protein